MLDAFVALALDCDKLRSEQSRICHHAFAQRGVKAVALDIEFLEAFAQCRAALKIAACRRALMLARLLQEHRQAFWCHQLSRQRREYLVVQLRLGDCDRRGTCCLALQPVRSARIVAVAATLAGANHERRAAAFAAREARQKNIAVRNARGSDVGTARVQQLLNATELPGWNDLRDRLRNPFAPGPRLFGPAVVTVEVMRAGIGVARQNRMDGAGVEQAITELEAVGIQPRGDILDTQRAASAVTLKEQFEDQPHRLGLLGFNFEALLCSLPSLLGGNGAIAEGRL